MERAHQYHLKDLAVRLCIRLKSVDMERLNGVVIEEELVLRD